MLQCHIVRRTEKAFNVRTLDGSNTKITEQRLIFAVQQNIFWLNIPMKQAFLMNIIQCFSNLLYKWQNVPQLVCFSLKLRQSAIFRVVHHQIGWLYPTDWHSKIQHTNNMGMPQIDKHPCLYSKLINFSAT